MGLHDPFGYLKHKLWPNEKSGIKLQNWFLTTKSWELPWFTYVEVACHISLENSQQGLQLCFRFHLNQRFTQKNMGFQSCGSPNFEIFKTPNLGVPGQNDIWVQALWPIRKYYKGEGDGFPQIRSVVSFVNLCLPVVCPCPWALPIIKHEANFIMNQTYINHKA